MIMLPGPDRGPIAVNPDHVTAVQPYHTGCIVWVDGRVLLRVNLDVAAVVEAIGHGGSRSLEAAYLDGYERGAHDAQSSGGADAQLARMNYHYWIAPD